ncbi:unnamed protein product [Eruca vesicaria subsp. sativa]|uniref:ARM repeat superfamily protein n=1 Tax=Eruca vesicaria subsp. sativa TaxID=29727 RepID=A0ABC8KXZ6_ERUVS|nr:unnamed protein product [Eruca vesicaria subsp. sativa]
MFTLSLRLAEEEGNPGLAKEAIEIAIWCLTENFDCWKCWKKLCTKANPEGSVVLLKTLVEKWNAHSLELSSPSTEAMKLIIQKMARTCLKIAIQGISILDTVVPGSPVLLGEASAVAILSLTEIVDCCKPWDNLYRMILNDSGTLLKNLVQKCKDDVGAPKSEAMEHVYKQIFTFSLRLAGKESPALAREAIEISIWSLTKNFDCCKQWGYLYKENIKASVALLKKLVHEWNDHSLSPSDTFTLSKTIKRFRNQKAIAEGGANVNLCKEADKFCKVISGRLSRRSCRLNGAFALVLVAARGICRLNGKSLQVSRDHGDCRVLKGSLAEQNDKENWVSSARTHGSWKVYMQDSLKLN